MLPSDRYLAELLGLSEEQYELWRDEVRKRAAEAPRPAVVAGELGAAAIVSIVLSVISVGAQLISVLLAPSAPRNRRVAELGQRQLPGRN